MGVNQSEEEPEMFGARETRQHRNWPRTLTPAEEVEAELLRRDRSLPPAERFARRAEIVWQLSARKGRKEVWR